MFRCFAISIAIISSALAQEKVTYDRHVQPIFQQVCLNCHNPDKSKGGLDLSTFAGTLKGGSGGKVVEPGDSTSSLISVVEHTGGPKMPPEGEKLSAAHTQTIRRWIEGGLLENPSSSARQAAKPKFASPRTNAAANPEGPPPMPADVLLEPVIVTPKPSAVRALAASPWAPLLAVTGQRQVLLFHGDTLDLHGVLPFPEGDPVSLAFCPDARHLIVGGGVPGKSGITVTFDITRGTRLLVAGKEFDSVLAADIRPGFDTVATGGPSRLVKLWDTTTGEARKSIKKHTEWITALDFSPDGVLLATGDRNGGVWVWESDTGNEFHTLRAHQGGITAAVFRADSNILSTSSADGTVRFWEMNGGSEVGKIDAHPGGVTAFSFARDGSALTVGRDHKARLWKPDFTPARELAAKLPALPVAAALNTEGTRAFVGLADGRILVILTADGKPAGELSNNPPSVQTRLRDLTGAITSKQQEIAAAEKNSASAPPALEAMRRSLGSLEKSRKHWSAAEINTRAITAREASLDADTSRVDAQDAFTRAATDLTARSADLAGKRARRAELAAMLQRDDLSAAAGAEGGATLALLDAVIGDFFRTQSAGEATLVKAREDADLSAQRFHEESVKARELGHAYRKAME